jgi:predicted permease
METSTIILLEALIKLFLMSLLGYLVVRFQILSPGIIKIISKFIITVSLPCLIIATVGTNLHYDMLGTLALGSLAALGLGITGIAFALLFRRLFIPPQEQGRRLFISLCSMQNSGYLPIPLVAAVLPEQLIPEGLLLTFVYIMVMGALFWSLGVRLITEGTAKDWRENIRNIANPPFIAVLFGLLFLVPQIKAGFTALPFLQESLTLVGNTTIPLVMIVLGGSFGSGISFHNRGGRIMGISALVKMMIIPVLVLLFVKVFEMNRIFGFVLVLQAAMPAAMNHIVVAREYGGNIPLTARTLFFHYVLSIVTVPIFLYLFGRL